VVSPDRLRSGQVLQPRVRALAAGRNAIAALASDAATHTTPD
jgi:hypothetical protein